MRIPLSIVLQYGNNFFISERLVMEEGSPNFTLSVYFLWIYLMKKYLLSYGKSLLNINFTSNTFYSKYYTTSILVVYVNSISLCLRVIRNEKQTI